MMWQHFQRWVYPLPAFRSGLCLVLHTLTFPLSASGAFKVWTLPEKGYWTLGLMQFGSCWRESTWSQRSLHQVRLVGLAQFAWFLLLYLSGSHSGRMAAGCCPPGDNILSKDFHINHWEVVVHSAIFVLCVACFPSDVTLTELVMLAWDLYCYSEQSN